MVAVVYFPALWGDFLWDDIVLVDEPLIRKGTGLWSIWFQPWAMERENHYWPVVYTSFWLEHKLWGFTPLGYHLVNVLLHLANSVLVWRLLSRLAVPAAWTVAALFAVHPLHVESVAWIIERKDLLSSLFYLTAAVAWFRFVETPGWGRYVLALALFTAGLLSKSVVVTLPAALLIWHCWKRGGVTPVDLRRLAPFFAVGLCIAMADFLLYASRVPLSLGYSMVERLLIAARAWWFYIGKLLWPTDLAVIYPLWEIRAGDPLAWAYVLAAAALLALLWFGRRWSGPGPLAGALFYTVTLSPMLGFVDHNYMRYAFVADRFQYLAGIGVMAVLAGGGAVVAARLRRPLRMAAPCLAAAILTVLGVMTWRQAGIYRDGAAFFGHIVAHNPEARYAHLNLARALVKENRPEDALAAARLAVEKLETRQDLADAHDVRGRALLNLGRLGEAGEALRRALDLDPGHVKARENMTELLRRQKWPSPSPPGFPPPIRAEGKLSRE